MSFPNAIIYGKYEIITRHVSAGGVVGGGGVGVVLVVMQGESSHPEM